MAKQGYEELSIILPTVNQLLGSYPVNLFFFGLDDCLSHVVDMSHIAKLIPVKSEDHSYHAQQSFLCRSFCFEMMLFHKEATKQHDSIFRALLPKTKAQ